MSESGCHPPDVPALETTMSKTSNCRAADQAAPDATRAPGALLTELEAAAALTLAPGTLRNWRSLGIGIPYLKLGKRAVRYHRADVDAFLARSMAQVEVAR